VRQFARLPVSHLSIEASPGFSGTQLARQHVEKMNQFEVLDELVKEEP